MFMSRRWRRSWRIPGRCRFRGVGQQPTKRDCATNRKRARNRAKTSLFSCESSLLCANFLPVMVLFCEMKLPVPGPGAAVARPARAISAAGRRHGGALSAPRLLRPQGGSCKWLAKVIFCAMFVPRPMGERHGQQTSAHRPRQWPSEQARLSPHPSRARFADSSPREARAPTRASSCSNALKTLKTAMGRPCNKLA